MQIRRFVSRNAIKMFNSTKSNRKRKKADTIIICVDLLRWRKFERIEHLANRSFLQFGDRARARVYFQLTHASDWTTLFKSGTMRNNWPRWRTMARLMHDLLSGRKMMNIAFAFAGNWNGNGQFRWLITDSRSLANRRSSRQIGKESFAFLVRLLIQREIITFDVDFGFSCCKHRASFSVTIWNRSTSSRALRRSMNANFQLQLYY